MLDRRGFKQLNLAKIRADSSMEKLTEILAMGGYGAFVWPSYALAFSVMLAMALASLSSLRKAKARLRDLQLLPDADET